MKIERKDKTKRLKVDDLEIGDIFSFEGCESVYLLVGNAAVCLETGKVFYDYNTNKEPVIRYKAKLIIEEEQRER